MEEGERVGEGRRESGGEERHTEKFTYVRRSVILECEFTADNTEHGVVCIQPDVVR